MATKGGPGDKYSYENILKEAKKKYPSKSNGDAIVEYIVDQEEPWKGASFEEKKAFFIKAYDKGVVELFPSDAANATPKNYDGVLSDATSGLRALGAAYLAKDGLPSWRPTDDYYKNYGDLKTRSNMGLSSEAKTYAEGMRNRAFSAGASQIGSIAGGGSSAAALGALSGLNESRFDSVNRSMLMDEAQRTLNQDKFTQAVGQDQNIDRMMYGDAYNQDMYKQQAANAAIAANLQNIEDRKDYEKTFGQGSNYEKMMNLKVEQSQLSNLAYRKFLQNQGLGGS